MIALPNTTHYLFFRHDATGVGATSFSSYLYKNGVYHNAISIEIETEADSGDSYMYKAYFTDDGTSPCIWDLVIVEDNASAVSDTNPTHQMRYLVEAPIDRQLLQRLRGGSEY